MNSQEIGKLGEEMAVKYLRKKGYKILDRNFEVRFSGPIRGEIDIVARKDEAICFIEVKTLKRTNGNLNSVGSFLAQDKVDFKKREKLIKTAEIWLSKNKIPLDSQWQIDVIAIKLNFRTKRAKISHFKNAVGL